MAKRCIKIYGLTRTCTNLTMLLLQRNFDCTVWSNEGDSWKHGRNKIENRKVNLPERNMVAEDIRFVICTKHPYTWFFSQLRWENRQGGFRRNMDDLLKYSNTYQGCPFKAYNELNKHWLTLSDDPAILQQVTQEELEADQGKVLARVEKAFDLPRLHTDWQLEHRSVRPNLKPTSAYQKRNQQLLPGQKAYADSKLDRETLQLLGYEL